MYKNLHGLGVASGFVASLFFTATPAMADPYKWCAVYRNGQNCGFVTIEQCRATVTGVGGFCEPNPFYTGPDRTQSAKPSTRSAKPTTAKPAEKRHPRTRPPKDLAPEDRFQSLRPDELGHQAAV